jgi:acyl-CoA synthetase (AMP-forming)/AMP-acid ligase II
MALVLGEVVRRNAVVVPDKPAYVMRGEDGGREVVTYRELDERANRCCSALAARGVRRGDRNAAMMPNNAAWPVVFFGALKLGAAVVPVNARFKTDEVAAQLAACRPAVLVAERDDGLVTADGMSFDELLSSGSPEEPGLPVDERDSHAIFYTSGTTGTPKGAVLSHRAYWLQTAQPIMSARGTGEDDVGLCMFPFFHMSGWANSLPFWRARATVVILRRPTPEAICAAFDEERVTQFYAIPETLRAVCAFDDIDGYDLSSLRELSSGTSAMSAEDIELTCERFGVDGIRIHYGSSEAGPCTVLPAEQSRTRPGSIGRAQVGCDVRLIGDDGADVASGEAGELVVRSDWLMDGYLDNPAATAEALEDGWYRTGDLALADDDGYLYICGRKRDVIRSGGETIFPSEVERTILELAGVRECTVVGVADTKWGEAALAAVVCFDDATVTVESVIAHCDARLAAYKRPRHVMFVDELPKAGATEKVQKSLVRERFEASRA